MEKITIKWYRKESYGQSRDYVHPVCEGDAKIIQQLTGKKTIDSATRELIRDLSRGHIQFEEVLAP